MRAGELVPATAIGSPADVDVRRVTVRADAASTAGLTRGSRVDVFVTPKAMTGGSDTPPETTRLIEGAGVATVSTTTGGLGANATTSVQLYVPAETVQPLVEAVDGDAKLTLVPAVGSVGSELPRRWRGVTDVITGLGPRWEASVATTLERVPGVTIARRCADVAELLSSRRPESARSPSSPSTSVASTLTSSPACGTTRFRWSDCIRPTTSRPSDGCGSWR